MNHELNKIVYQFKEDITSLLDQKIIDVVIYGSAVRGGFVPFKSDIDFIVFLNGNLSSSNILGLKKYHRDIRCY